MNDPATTEFYSYTHPLSLPAALPIFARVAVLQRLHLPRQARLYLRQDLVLHQQKLDRGANLAGLAIARTDDLRQRAIEVRVVAEDGEGDGAEFHLGAPETGCMLDRAARFGASGERKEAHARSSDERRVGKECVSTF